MAKYFLKGVHYILDLKENRFGITGSILLNAINAIFAVNLHFGFGSPMTRNENEKGSPVWIFISVSGRDKNNGHLPPLTAGPTIWTLACASVLPNALVAWHD